MVYSFELIGEGEGPEDDADKHCGIEKALEVVWLLHPFFYGSLYCIVKPNYERKIVNILNLYINNRPSHVNRSVYMFSLIFLGLWLWWCWWVRHVGLILIILIIGYFDFDLLFTKALGGLGEMVGNYPVFLIDGYGKPC